MSDEDALNKGRINMVISKIQETINRKKSVCRVSR